ncbi:hypothetical protein ABIF03_001997 [Bradyrhizobium elkanii]
MRCRKWRDGARTDGDLRLRRPTGKSSINRHLPGGHVRPPFSPIGLLFGSTSTLCRRRRLRDLNDGTTAAPPPINAQPPINEHNDHKRRSLPIGLVQTHDQGCRTIWGFRQLSGACLHHALRTATRTGVLGKIGSRKGPSSQAASEGSTWRSAILGQGRRTSPSTTEASTLVGKSDSNKTPYSKNTYSPVDTRCQREFRE